MGAMAIKVYKQKPSVIIPNACSMQKSVCMCVVLLGHQGEGLGTDGRAGYQADGNAPQRSRVVNTHDCFKSRTNRVDISLLAVLVPSACVQDVPSVQNQDQHMDLGRLHTLLRRALLRTENEKRKGGWMGMTRNSSWRMFDKLEKSQTNKYVKAIVHQIVCVLSDLWAAQQTICTNVF